MRVAICQYDMAWEKTAENLIKTEKMVAAAEADLVVLPEMFATGFKLKPSCVAETMEGSVVTAMRRWAVDYRKAVVGTVVISENGEYRNRMLFVKPSGEMIRYDKHHLFRPGGEGRDYTPGGERVIVEYMGVRFLLEICYDLRFPVWSRNRGDYDAIIYSASWADDRREAWRILLRARAIENECYVVGVNRVGSDPDGYYVGDSAVIDFMGRTIVDAGDGEQIRTAKLDMRKQSDFRQKFPTWKDADSFVMEL